jgi:exopolysaccharide biosynthesis WecB/TagA/CpsF family protein
MENLIVFHSPGRGAADAATPVFVGIASQAALLADLETLMRAGEGFAVATLNLDHLVKLRRSAAFQQAYAQHSHVTADGMPVVWLHRLAGRRIDLVPGSDLVRPLAALAAAMRIPVALFGSTPAVLERAAVRLRAEAPGLCIVDCIAPPHGFDPDGPEAAAFLDRLAASGARLCFLALGAPKQERLALRGRKLMPACGFVSIGAGLDFVAGHERRAPPWVRRLAMEWAWRLAGNPRRLARRYLDCALILPGLGLAALRARRQAPTGLPPEGRSGPEYPGAA